MYMKKQKSMALAVGILFIFMTFMSLFFIEKEADHVCTGEDCPICACLHQVEQIFKNLGLGITVSIAESNGGLLSGWMMTGLFSAVFVISLVSQKVRLNN